MIGFLGEYEATLDAKGRFLLPGAIKKQLPEGEPASFVLSRGFEECLTLYPVKNWETIFKSVSELNDFEPKVRRFQRQFLNGAMPIELDSAGRILISKSLLDYAGLQKDIILVSVIKKIEIWDVVKYKKLFEQDSPEAFSSLANEVMGKGTINNG